MNAMHPVHRIASFATVPAIVGAVSGCNRHGTDNGAGNTGAVSGRHHGSSAERLHRPRGRRRHHDRQLGAVEHDRHRRGAAMDDTARGTTARDMSASGAPPAAATGEASTGTGTNSGNANDNKNGSEKANKP